MNWNWEDTREAFLDWVGNWSENSGVKDCFEWKGFSLWWVSNLTQKDTLYDKQWYQEIHSSLSGKEAKKFDA
jgi:hypothetical protein